MLNLDWNMWHDHDLMLEFHREYFNKVDMLIYRRIGEHWRKCSWQPWWLFNPLQSLIHAGSVYNVNQNRWISVENSLTCLNPPLCPYFVEHVQEMQIEVDEAAPWYNTFAVNYRDYQTELSRFFYNIDTYVSEDVWSVLCEPRHGDRDHRTSLSLEDFTRDLQLSIYDSDGPLIGDFDIEEIAQFLWEML